MVPSTLWRNSVSPAVSAIARRLSPFPRVRRLRALAAHSVPPPVYAFLPHMRLSYVTSGSSGTLRRLRVQWRGLARRAWPAVAFKVCPLRAAPSARHLAAALHPLVANAGRSLCTQWPVWGSDASAFTIAGPDVSWWAHSGPPRVPLARQTPPPVPSVAPRCASVLPVCARPAPTVHLVGYRGP